MPSEEIFDCVKMGIQETGLPVMVKRLQERETGDQTNIFAPLIQGAGSKA